MVTTNRETDRRKMPMTAKILNIGSRVFVTIDRSSGPQQLQRTELDRPAIRFDFSAEPRERFS